MKLGILADIHEDVDALSAALTLLRREGVDRVVASATASPTPLPGDSGEDGTERVTDDVTKQGRLGLPRLNKGLPLKPPIRTPGF